MDRVTEPKRTVVLPGFAWERGTGSRTLALRKLVSKYGRFDTYIFRPFLE